MAATSAFAQTTVEIYGRAHVAYDAQYKTTGGTAITGTGAIAAGNGFDLQNRARVADDGSRIGFRVTEDLGSGAYAKAVIETGINLDTNSANGQSGAANSGTGYFGSRDAWVGLGNAMGDIRMGRQNNFWGNGAIEDVGANRIHFSINGAYTAPSSGWISGPAARVDNTLKFVANKGLAGAFAGSEIWIAHPNAAEQAAPNTAATNVTSAGVKANQAGDILAKAQGLTLKFNQGPWAAQYDYAQNKNQLNGVQTAAGANTNQWANGPVTLAAAPAADSTLTGAKLGLAYSYADGSKVYFINSTFKQEYATLSSMSSVYAVIPAAANSVPLTIGGGDRKQSNNLIGVQHRIGNWELHAAYAKQGDLKIAGETLENSGSSAYTLGARYELSKRTALTVATTQIKNDANNNINNSGGGQSSVAAIGYGAKLSQFGASIQHNF